MLKAKRDRRFFVAAIAVYALAVICFSVAEYYHSKESLLAEVDQKLYEAATVADNLLLKEMRDNVAGERPLTFDEDYFLAIKLQDLADDLSVEYIYSVKEQNGDILFLASNMSPEERASAFYEPVNLTLYSDAPDAIYTAFGFLEPQFSRYEDGWGSFRSLFLPFVSQQQVPYVIGIDVSIEELRAIAIKSVIKAIAYGLLLGFIAFPMVFLYGRLFKRHYLNRVKAAESHPITGLPNKRCLVRKIESSPSPAQHLLLIEVENFHDISNLNGIAFGDQLLLKIQYCLREVAVSGIEYCEFYHLDESLFGVYAQHALSRRQQVDIVSECFNDLVKMSVRSIDGRAIPLILRLSTASNDLDVYTLARMALNYAAENDKTFVEYHPTLELPTYFQRHLDVYHGLNECINNNQVKVFYQPIVDTRTGKAVKYEALIRLLSNNPDGVLSPEEFMPIAYRSRLCHKLARMVVDEVITCVKKQDKVVSINLSVKDLFDQSTRDYLIQETRKHNVGHLIEFELLEQQSISDYKRAAAYIRQLKSCVSAVGIDDLGKLYSNFDRLLELPLDFVKIDGALVESLISNEESQSIVSGIVLFAEKRGMKVIAEFCSSREVCQKVNDMNIHLMQGFHICEPKASISEIDAQLEERSLGF